MNVFNNTQKKNERMKEMRKGKFQPSFISSRVYHEFRNNVAFDVYIHYTLMFLSFLLPS